MIARRGAGIILIAVSLFLVLGCGRDRDVKSEFELGKEEFEASNYVKSMMRLETWLKEDPGNLQGHNTEAHAMLAVMYRNDETRQELYKDEFGILQNEGEAGMAAVLKLVENPTIASRLGNTIRDILVQGGELSVPPLISYFTGPNARLRNYAKSVLVALGKPAVPSLVKLLEDPGVYVRSRTVETLSAIGDKSTIEPLKKMLDDSSKLVQVQAASALYRMGQSKDTEKVIIGAMEHEDVQTRRVAVRAVSEFMNKPPLKPMMKAMKDADADVRNYAVKAVGKIGSSEAIELLIEMLQEDPNDQVKTSVADTLVKIGKPAVDPLLRVLEGKKDFEITIRVVQILGNIGDKRAIKPLEKIYNESNNSVLKDNTAKALNKID